MAKEAKVKFAGGRNIAMKVTPHLWEATVQFYRDVLALKVIEHAATVPPSVGFEFGPNRLWIDRVDGISQAELWLELTASDVQEAVQHLKSAGVVRRDEIEQLPAGFEGFWIQSPASIIHLVSQPNQS
jgi:hypothetical protein